MGTDKLRGRKAEEGAIGRALDRLYAGRSGFVCIAGEPGIGKTSLLQALGSRAAERGMLVLGGSGAEFERAAPFGIFVEALDDHLETLGGRAAERVAAEHLAHLGPVFPALAADPAKAQVDAGDDRHRTFGAVRSLLETLSSPRRPLVLLIDDLHWGDEGSLELVLHLARRPPRAPVLVAVAYRPLLLARLAGTAQTAFLAAEAGELIEPRALSREHAAELVGGLVAPSRLDALVRESGGNPFYLLQLARTEAEGGAPGDLELSELPPAVAGSLARELECLSEDAQAVCQAAAVAGDPFDAHLVEAAAGRSEVVTLAAIGELTRMGTVCLDAKARRFHFRHPIVRRAAYQAADPGARLLAHRRLAVALEARGASPLERAHHVEASAVPGDTSSATLLASAARAAAGRAPAIASRWYASAVDLLPASFDPAERAGLLVALAMAQGSAGLLEQSRQTLLEVLDTLPSELEPFRLRILPFLALIGHMLGRHGEATAMLRRALGELPDPRTPEAAELGIATALDCLYEPDHAAMLRYAGPSDRAAGASGDRGLEAAGAGVSALAHYHAGDIPMAQAECERARKLADSLTDTELASRLEGMLSIAWTAMSLELYDDCIALADRGLSISRASGQGHLVVPLTIARVVSRTWQGELTETAAETDDLIDAGRFSGVGQWIAWTLTLRGWIATLAGELELAAECGEEACSVAGGQNRPSYFVAHSILHLAETRLEQGRARECLEELVTAAGGPGLPICEPPIRPRYYEILTRASLALGRQGDAREWADRAKASAAGSPLGGRRAEAGMADAAVLLANTEMVAADRRALEAARDADGAGDRLLATRARVLAARGRVLDDRSGAIKLLESSRAEFSSYGASRSRDEVTRELRRLGRRIEGGGRRAKSGHGVPALSDREREVAELVTTGMTNREIAARLFLSEKTVESHLAAVFRKLGVRGRAAIGTVLLRRSHA